MLNHYQSRSARVKREVRPLRSGYRGRSAGLGRGLGLAALVAVPSVLTAQDALQDLKALDTARDMRREQVASPDYNFKKGDFRMTVRPSLGLDWNDNINNSDTDKESDFILKPFLQLGMTYPITQVNLLAVNLGIGYDYYFDHHDESAWRIQTGSALSFDIFVKDFVINLHDRISYSRDSSQEAAVANTSDFGNFENTIGVLTAWNLAKGTVSLGYDHQNVISGESDFDSQNHASEIVLLRGSYLVHPQVQTGLEGTVSFTKYDQPTLNDNTAYSIGPFVSWQPGSALNVMLRGGYVYYDFQQTSTSIQTENLSTYYFDFTVNHDATEVISYGFSAGRNVRLGVEADAIEEWYVRPNVTWRIFQHISLNTGLSYEHGDQGAGDITGGLVETYDWFGATIGVNWPIMKRLALGLNYRITLRDSDLPDRGYTQNVIGLTASYIPQ